MPHANDHDSLERRTVDAHRAYLVSLIRAERAEHRPGFPRGGEHRAAQRTLAGHRIVLRDLLAELGYIPNGLATRSEVWPAAVGFAPASS